MKTIIIEDESLTASRLQGLLHKYDPSISVLAILPSVEEATVWFETHPEPDLVFMDIHLEDDLAFKLFEKVQIKAPIVFTTAYDEYMIQAFKVNSIDYLLKPINFDELVQAIEKYKSLKSHFSQTNLEVLMQYIGQKEAPYKQRFMVTVGTKIKSIETKDIAFFYSEDKMTFLVTKDGQHLPIDFSLDKLAAMLSPIDFFRISRQSLVSFNAIQAAHSYFKGKLKLDVLPKSKVELLVNSDRVTDFKEWLGR